MTSMFLNQMMEATALTRAGKLHEATALLRNSLNPARADDPAPDADAIEGSFRILDETPPRPAATPRKRLGATLRDLSAKRRVGTKTATAPNAQFTRHQFVAASGSCDYMVFTPSPLPSAPCPVIIMLHGCTQTADDFAVGTQMNALAQSHGVIVVYPEQKSSANANKCWNWFRPQDQNRTGGEPEMLADLARKIIAEKKADPSRVYVAGLSAGGAAAAVLAHSYPDLFAGVGIHSGLAAGAAKDVTSAFSAMRNGASGTDAKHHIPTIVFHGTADATVNVANAKAITKQALAAKDGHQSKTTRGKSGTRSYQKNVIKDATGQILSEVWLIEGAGHAWSGGSPTGSYTDSTGPNASAEMLRFFLDQSL